MLNLKMIGNKITEARKKAQVSQAQLAQGLFVSPQAVGKWERGESLLDIITLNRLAEILGVELNYFSENYQTEVAVANNETEQSTTNTSKTKDSLLINFSGSMLPKSDFAGVIAHNNNFNGSMLQGSDFSGADLSGSNFSASDVREATFDGCNLSDCKFSATDLSNANFHKSILDRTNFSSSTLNGARFKEVNFKETKLTTTDLRSLVFEHCSFNGTDFSYSDLREQCFDRQSFIGVKFDMCPLNKASFKGATLQNVSFRASFAITNKYYRALKTICFDDATMDKLTYAALKGIGVDLTGVKVV